MWERVEGTGGFLINGYFFGSAEAPGEIKSNTELMAQAENLGKKLAGS